MRKNERARKNMCICCVYVRMFVRCVYVLCVRERDDISQI